jgi:AAA15 family ATPase/GTPase
MSTYVLKSLFAENYAPFAERINFTTVADFTKKEYIENTFKYGDLYYNKVSYIYGANGSGKSFFCRILSEIQRIITLSHFSLADNSQLFSKLQFKGIDASVAHFAFDTSYADKPIKLGVELVIDEVIYHYEFDILGKSVIYELLTKKYRRTETLLSRSSASNKSIELKSEFKDFDTKVIKDEALCLSMMAMLNNSLAKKIVKALASIDISNMAHPIPYSHDAEKSFSEERLKEYVQVLKKADPTIRKLSVSLKEEETGRQKISVDDDDFENKEIISTTTTLEVKSEHAVYDKGVETTSTPIDFFMDESMGTSKLFSVLTKLYNVLENGGVLFLDEIENGLHLSLVRELISLFLDERTNPNHAQLICTSHQPLLVDKNVRRDQVWVTSKDELGKSSLSCVSELKLSKAKLDISRRLLEGALGCNPEQFFEAFRK